MKKYIALLFIGWMMPSSAAVYSISSENFIDVFGSYSTSDNITGVVVTGSSIPQNGGLVDISADLISYSFSDGVQTLDQNNSTVLFFSLAVNGSNQVTETAITIWKTPVTTMPGGLVEGMDIYSNSTFAQVVGFKDGSCQLNGGPGGTCTQSISTDTNSGQYIFYDPIFMNGFE